MRKTIVLEFESWAALRKFSSLRSSLEESETFWTVWSWSRTLKCKHDCCLIEYHENTIQATLLLKDDQTFCSGNAYMMVEIAREDASYMIKVSQELAECRDLGFRIKKSVKLRTQGTRMSLDSMCAAIFITMKIKLNNFKTVIKLQWLLLMTRCAMIGLAGHLWQRIGLVEVVVFRESEFLCNLHYSFWSMYTKTDLDFYVYMFSCILFFRHIIVFLARNNHTYILKLTFCTQPVEICTHTCNGSKVSPRHWQSCIPQLYFCYWRTIPAEASHAPIYKELISFKISF